MKKEELKDVLVKYDAKMFTLQEELENIQCVLDREADELRYFKVFTEDVHLQIFHQVHGKIRNYFITIMG